MSEENTAGQEVERVTYCSCGKQNTAGVCEHVPARLKINPVMPSSSPTTPEPRYPHRAEFSVNDEVESAVESPAPSKWDEYMKQHGREEYGMESPEQRLERELHFRIEWRNDKRICGYVVPCGDGDYLHPNSHHAAVLWRKCLTLMEQVEQLTHELVCSQDQYRDCHRDWIEMKTRAEAAEAKLREQVEAVGELKKAAARGMVVIAGLHLGVEWELAPQIVGELGECADQLRTALERIERGEQS